MLRCGLLPSWRSLPSLICHPDITNLTPSSLRMVATGFRFLVKTQGALDNPKGRQVNWKIGFSIVNLSNF